MFSVIRLIMRRQNETRFNGILILILFCTEIENHENNLPTDNITENKMNTLYYTKYGAH